MNDPEKTLDRLYKLAEFIESAQTGVWAKAKVMVRYYLRDAEDRIIDIPKNGEGAFICGGVSVSSWSQPFLNGTESQALHCATLLSRHTAFNDAYLRWVAPSY